MYGINREEPNKEEKSWGYRLSFSIEWIEDEQHSPFSVAFLPVIATLCKILEMLLGLSIVGRGDESLYHITKDGTSKHTRPLLMDNSNHSENSA